MTSRLTSFDRLEKEQPDTPSGATPARAAATRRIASSARLQSRPLARGVATTVLVAAICLLCAIPFDEPLVRWARQLSPGTRGVARVVSDLGLSGYMLVISGMIAAGAYAAMRRGRFRNHVELLKLVGERACFVFSVVAVSGVAVQIIKHVVGRARPGLIDRYGAFYFDSFSLKASLASFPSGHATSIFALATALGFIAPRTRLFAFGLAVLVGLARIVLAAHYLSDVAAGAVLGVAVALGMAGVFADRSIAFTRVEGAPHLKGRGLLPSALQGRRSAARVGA